MSAVELSLTAVMDKIVVDDWAQCRQGPSARCVPTSSRACSTRTTSMPSWARSSPARTGRETDDERILFWHRGLATTDVAVGHLLYERATERGVGTMLHYR